jgi:hypothetical protein
MTTIHQNAILDTDDDLEITKVTRRAAAAGTWVRGTIAGYRFDALVFPAHADNRDWEMGDSRISKLWVKHLADHKIVFNWDRRLDIAAADHETLAIVDFLAAGLADYVYAE